MHGRSAGGEHGAVSLPRQSAAHKRVPFHHLTVPWQDLFSDRFDVLLYNLTSLTFEFPPPENGATSSAMVPIVINSLTVNKSPSL